jgi:hypothetical protein
VPALLLLAGRSFFFAPSGCGKTYFPEGYGLQAARKCFAMNSALAAEGRIPLTCPGVPWEAALFPQPFLTGRPSGLKN